MSDFESDGEVYVLPPNLCKAPSTRTSRAESKAALVIVFSGACETAGAFGFDDALVAQYYRDMYRDVGLDMPQPFGKPNKSITIHGVAVMRWRLVHSLDADIGHRPFASVVLPALAASNEDTRGFVAYEVLGGFACLQPYVCDGNYQFRPSQSVDCFTRQCHLGLGNVCVRGSSSLLSVAKTLQQQHGLEGVSLRRFDTHSALAPLLVSGRPFCDARPLTGFSTGSSRYSLHCASHPNLLLHSSRAACTFRPCRETVKCFRIALETCACWPTRSHHDFPMDESSGFSVTVPLDIAGVGKHVGFACRNSRFRYNMWNSVDSVQGSNYIRRSGQLGQCGKFYLQSRFGAAGHRLASVAEKFPEASRRKVLRDRVRLDMAMMVYSRMTWRSHPSVFRESLIDASPIGGREILVSLLYSTLLFIRYIYIYIYIYIFVVYQDDLDDKGRIILTP
jgi:hypothetical protein